MIRTFPRWRSAIGASLVVVALGVLRGSPLLIATAIIPLVYVLAGAVSGVPEALENVIEVEREFSGIPVPGEPVTVSVTVSNPSPSPLPDLRFIDGVPDNIRVVDGSPRSTISLAGNDSTTFSYDVMAIRGDHEFTAPTIQTRNLTATTANVTTVPVTGETTLKCRIDLDELALPTQTVNYTGELPTENGGVGVEFFSTREYRRGDPMNRINWRQLAKTGELTTVNYREHQAAKAVLVVDARQIAYVAAADGYPTAVELSAYAARRALDALTDAGHLVGIATIGADTDITPAVPPLEWVEPSSGAELKAQAATVFETVIEAGGVDTDPLAAASPTADTTAAADGGADPLVHLRKYLPNDAQVLFFTPALDDPPLDLVETLHAHGHETTVLSPDITAASETVGGSVTAIERGMRLTHFRDIDAHVVDWNSETPLPLALAAALDPYV